MSLQIMPQSDIDRPKSRARRTRPRKKDSEDYPVDKEAAIASLYDKDESMPKFKSRKRRRSHSGLFCIVLVLTVVLLVYYL